MGKWIGYHLTIGPGDRDPRAVATDLRDELPGVLHSCLGEHTDLDEVIYEDEPHVWVDDGLVHWTTGENHRVGFDFWDGLVPALAVPAAWACGVWQMEVEWYGGAEVYGWVDGRFVKVDELQGRYGRGAEDALASLEREWNVSGEVVS